MSIENKPPACGEKVRKWDETPGHGVDTQRSRRPERLKNLKGVTEVRSEGPTTEKVGREKPHPRPGEEDGKDTEATRTNV